MESLEIKNIILDLKKDVLDLLDISKNQKEETELSYQDGVVSGYYGAMVRINKAIESLEVMYARNGKEF